MPEPNLQPPQPPPFDRRIRFLPIQVVGIPLLFLLPVLALFGVFGETFTSQQASNEALEVEIEYATRYRYKMINEMKVGVRNLAEQTPVTVTVTFDRSYVDQFSTVTFTPDAKEVTADNYVVELPGIPPDDSRFVSVELQGERYWRHEGIVATKSGDTTPVAIPVSTWIFP